MDTRKVEITEERLLDGTTEYVAGDVKTLPKAKADEWVRLGWAKCCETGETGDRRPGSNGPLSPDSVTTALA